MLRVLLQGLLVSNIRRTAVAASSHTSLHSRSLASTCRNPNNHINLNTMDAPENAFEKMAEEGLPHCTGPRQEEIQKEEEEKALPKLTKEQFRQYNSMAEHMNYFVRRHPTHCTSFR